jgi:flagellum-specific ATP synthase
VGVEDLGLSRLQRQLAQANLVSREGHVVQVVGTVVEAELPGVAVGELTEVGDSLAEVVGFREDRALLMPLGSLAGVAHGTKVRVRSQDMSVPVGPGLLGRVIDPMGLPLDGRPLTGIEGSRSLRAAAPEPMSRERIQRALETRIRAIDGLLTLGEGQRIAIMAGSGVGKSTLLGMFARSSQADVNVVALIGERGREVLEFLERDLGAEGKARSVMVVATSDRTPVMQVKGMITALAIAEHYRDQGKKVLFMCDSITRLAMAQRQIGLAAGEPPATKGYTPSVFSLIPSLLERLGQGRADQGSITGVLTVLVEGDDMEDPVADTVRGVVDGHLVLSRKLASLGHYPPIDILESVSRTMPETVTESQLGWAAKIRALLAVWRENEELIRLGAYKKGTDPSVDEAILLHPKIELFLKQRTMEETIFQDTVRIMAALSGAEVAQPPSATPPRGKRRGGREQRRGRPPEAQAARSKKLRRPTKQPQKPSEAVQEQSPAKDEKLERRRKARQARREERRRQRAQEQAAADK